MKRTVLFLCTGNYYRSRFAEELFNQVAQSRSVGWRAISRGLAEELWGRNVGPISPHTIDGLRTLGIEIPQPRRFPRALQKYEIETADVTIALNECEHRPLMTDRFPDWSDRIEYWSFRDVDLALPSQVLPLLESAIRTLIDRLSMKK